MVLPVLAALALGWHSRRKNILNNQVVDGIKALVMRYMLPAVLLGAFYKTTFSAHLLIIALCMFCCCLVGLGFGALVVRGFKAEGKMLPFFTCGFEAGMMGYGLYAMLFPSSQMHHFAMVDLGQVLFVFTVYSALLNKRQGVSTKQTLQAMIFSPVFLAIATGVILSASGLGALLQQSPGAAPIDAILGYISAPTGMLMIFVVGYQLEWGKRSLKAAALTVAVRTVIMSGLCVATLLVLGRLLPLETPLFWAIILMFTLPAPFVLPIFFTEDDQKGYISTALSLNTLLSVAFFAVISFFR